MTAAPATKGKQSIYKSELTVLGVLILNNVAKKKSIVVCGKNVSLCKECNANNINKNSNDSKIFE